MISANSFVFFKNFGETFWKTGKALWEIKYFEILKSVTFEVRNRKLIYYLTAFARGMF